MEGTPALNVWDTITDVLQAEAGGDSKPIHQTQIRKRHDPCGDVDYVPPNARLSSMQTALYIFADNEVVMKRNKNRQMCLLQCVIYRAHHVDLDGCV